MTSVYYWVPTDRPTWLDEPKGVIDLEEIDRRHGLKYVLEDRNQLHDQVVFNAGNPGPSGIGVLLYPKPVGRSDVPGCFYDPDRQEWFDCGRFWIGVEHDGDVDLTSEYFRKNIQSPGYLMEDAHGDAWRVTEDALVAASGSRRARLASHRAFWFGWHAAHPDTALLGVPHCR